MTSTVARGSWFVVRGFEAALKKRSGAGLGNIPGR